LHTRRKNLKKEGFLILYKANWGIKLINHVGNTYKKTLKVLSYVSIGTGYILMAGMIYFAYMIVKIYIFRPDVVSMIRVPPIMPLVPYVDKLVPGLPSFNFTYWIIVLAIIAITHEFAHGIFAAYNKIKIKKTGFGFFPFFLPIFLAAFVELDEKRMAKKSKFSQMAILSAGTFANVITAILFFIILLIFFATAFSPSGIVFDSYTYSAIGLAEINSINGIQVNNITFGEIKNYVDKEDLTKIEGKNKNYFVNMEILELQNPPNGTVIFYDDAPAINQGLIPEKDIIAKLNGVNIKNIDDLREEILKYSPGDKVVFGIKDGKNIYDKEIVLGEYPGQKGLPWIGIGFSNENARSGILGKAYDKLSSFKQSHVNYESKLGSFGDFIYLLLWWIILISVSVALVNMLPVGIFDGGRFFYLTILGLTKNDKFAKKTFSLVTYFFLALLLVLMLFWAYSFIK
ncbi:MAG: site-2 protease family protein, partial [Nanoarchaeota archaeon]